MLSLTTFAIAAGVVLLAKALEPGPAPIDWRALYGPVWRNQRPPGLPLPLSAVHELRRRLEAGTPAASAFEARWRALPLAQQAEWAPYASIVGAAAGPVDRAARASGLGPAFTRTLQVLGQKESGMTLRRPADTFDARCTHDAPSSDCTLIDGTDPRGGVITAYDWCQWNRDAGRGTNLLADVGVDPLHVAPDWMPWRWTERQAVDEPVTYYARLWSRAARLQAAPADAAWLLFLWQSSPVAARNALIHRMNGASWADARVRLHNEAPSHAGRALRYAREVI